MSPIMNTALAYSPPAAAPSPRSRAAPPQLRVVDHPVQRMQEIAGEFVSLIEEWASTAGNGIAMDQLAQRLINIVDSAPNISLGHCPYVHTGSISMRHAYQVAILSVHLCRMLRAPEAVVRICVKAALMMNIASFGLQDELSTPWGRPTLAQRVQLARHPLLAAELVAATPGCEPRWKSAVEQHHEAMDGSGYPYALSGRQICPEARIIKVADLWWALTHPRPPRTPKTPPDALHHLISRSQQQVDKSVLKALRGLVGDYPPGALVRLANREIALVPHWARGGGPPRHVLSIFSARNTPLREPSERDTRKAAFAVRSYASLPLMNLPKHFWKTAWSAACRCE